MIVYVLVDEYVVCLILVSFLECIGIFVYLVGDIEVIKIIGLVDCIWVEWKMVVVDLFWLLEVFMII